MIKTKVHTQNDYGETKKKKKKQMNTNISPMNQMLQYPCDLNNNRYDAMRYYKNNLFVSFFFIF